MPLADIDFGENGNQTPVQTTEQQTKPEEEVTHIHGNEENTEITPKPGEETTPPGNGGEEKPHDLEVGSIVSFNDVDYTVAENGDLVDDKGNVFKAAADVKSWMESLETVNDDELTIDNIIAQFNQEITDEQGNKVEFENTPAGVKSYVDSIIALKSKEIQDASVNKVFEDMPILKDFAQYVIANGGDYRGFGEMRDRTGIELDENNVEQQKAIIRAAWEENGKRGDVEQYIKYCEDSGQLVTVAREDLQALKDADAANKLDIERRAQEAREEEIRMQAEYWDTVNKTINSRVICGYKLPETVTITKDGKQISRTMSDFYDYISRPIDDKTGDTAYSKHLKEVKPQDALEKDILDAFLAFTGGSYKDLIDMAIKEEQVKRMVLKSKNNKKTTSVQVRKPASKGGNINDIVL